jgi:hypothetical protein
MEDSHPRRLRRTVCATRNSEYHIEDGICVGVRDRVSGAWMGEHQALQRTLTGTLMYRDGDVVLCSSPMAGDHLVFEGGSAVTSAIVEVWTERRTVAFRPRRLIDDFSFADALEEAPTEALAG